MKWYSIYWSTLAVLLIFSYCNSNMDGQTSDHETFDTTSSEVNFTVAGINYIGYLAQPDQDSDYPVVLILHGSEGYQNHHKSFANSIAEEGYIALAYCWFGCNTRPTQADVRTADFHNVLQYLRGLPNANSEKSGIVGFSAGACMSIYLGTVTPGLSGIVEYYGINRIPAEASRIVAENGGTVLVDLSKLVVPLFVIQGTADTVTLFDDVQNMVAKLDSLGKSYQLTFYAGATHSFNWPEKDGQHGIVYDENATRDAMDRTIIFLDQYLK